MTIEHMKKRIAAKLTKHPWGLVSMRTVHLRHYLKQVGWFKSAMYNVPVDKEGNPLPWITYPSIRFIEERVSDSHRVFEFGSGNSTLWWQSRVKEVVALEHNKDWFDLIAPKLGDKVKYMLCEDKEDYASAIRKNESKYQIIVIDGIERNDCAKSSLGALAEDGIVIWDNTERNEYENGTGFIENQGYKRLDSWGLGPISWSEGCTSIFYRNNNCFGI